MKEFRIGYGEDIHVLEKGRKLVLGGIEVPSSVGSLAHSDGDCLYHAIADALLGAVGDRDIGHLFPDDDPETEGIDSSFILLAAGKKAEDAGYVVSNLDCHLALECPKVGPYVAAMKAKTAALLEIEESDISIKAGTEEGLGPIGEGKAVRATAVVLLVRKEQHG